MSFLTKMFGKSNATTPSTTVKHQNPKVGNDHVAQQRQQVQSQSYQQQQQQQQYPQYLPARLQTQQIPQLQPLSQVYHQEQNKRFIDSP